jgi:tetratricopeptide (TPR) repeat protein
MSPGHFALHKTRTMTTWRLERYEATLAAYDRALALNPARADVWVFKGTLLCYGLRHYEAALAAYNQAMTMGISSEEAAVAWFGTATALRKLKRYRAAWAAFLRCGNTA